MLKLKASWVGALLFAIIVGIFIGNTALAAVDDQDTITDKRWVISELYLGGDDYKGAYFELYNNSDHNGVGWKDFVVNLPWDLDIPPIYDFHTYLPHTYKVYRMAEGWEAWLAKNYLKLAYGDREFFAINDALDLTDGYSYQRCQVTMPDGSRQLTKKFYYGKKSPGKRIPCSDKSISSTKPSERAEPGLCKGLKLSEIGANLPLKDQFIEVVNTSDHLIDLSQCYLTTSLRQPNLFTPIGKIELEPEELAILKTSGTELHPLSKYRSTVYIVDSDRTTSIDHQRYKLNKSFKAWARDDKGVWQPTYKATPADENIISDEFTHKGKSTKRNNSKSSKKDSKKSGKHITAPPTCKKSDPPRQQIPPGPKEHALPACPAGKYRDPISHRCRNVPIEPAAPFDCPTGSYLNPETGRCKKFPVNSGYGGKTEKPCRKGYQRDVATGICRRIIAFDDSNKTASSSNKAKKTAPNKPKPCRPGYTRNPDTGRCRKIYDNESPLASDMKESTNPKSAKYPLDPNQFTAKPVDNAKNTLIIISSLAGLAALLLIFQYRSDIINILKRFFGGLPSANTPSNPQTSPSSKKAPGKVSDKEIEKSIDDWIDELSR